RRRQHLQRRDERQRHALPRAVLRRRILRHEPRRRNRLEPLRLGRPLRRRNVRRVRRPELRPARASRPYRELVEAHVRGDAVQPRAHQRRILERALRAKRARQRLLHHVVRVARGAEHSITVEPQPRPVRLHLFLEVDHAAARTSASMRRTLGRVSIRERHAAAWRYGLRSNPQSSRMAAWGINAKSAIVNVPQRYSRPSRHASSTRATTSNSAVPCFTSASSGGPSPPSFFTTRSITTFRTAGPKCAFCHDNDRSTSARSRTPVGAKSARPATPARY